MSPDARSIFERIPSIAPIFGRSVFAAVISPLAFFFFAHAQSDAPPAVRSNPIEARAEQNFRVLSGRVREILVHRFRGFDSCGVEIGILFRQRLDALPPFSERREDSVATLQLFLDSRNLNDRACALALDRAEQSFHRDERRRFTALGRLNFGVCRREAGRDRILDPAECGRAIHQVLSDLDPHCVSVQAPNPNGYYDGFPCMAGDHMIGRYLYNQPWPERLITDTRLYFAALRQRLREPERWHEGRVDLFVDWVGYFGDGVETRKRFLALMTMIHASTDSLSSYIKGFHDYFWRAHLLKTGSAEAAVDYFNHTRLLIDEFRTIERILAPRAGARLAIGDRELARLNRHDFMSATLACYYGDQSALVRKWLPIALGTAYESYDFVSHLNEGISVQASIQNFRTDTRRYRQGVRWGVEFCRIDPSNMIGI